MPLSEHEQRLLDDIEKALYADDPKFASSVRSAKARRPGRRWIAVSVVGVVLGLALVLLGLMVHWALGVAGFLVIVGSIAYAARMMHATPGAPTDISSLAAGGRGGRPAPGRARPAPNSVRSRMEQRMRKRFEENGG